MKDLVKFYARPRLKSPRARQILKVAAVACLFIVLLPLVMAIIFGVSASRTMGLVGATFVLEYLAIPLGVGLKLPPVYVFLTVVSTGVGIFTLVLGIFQLLGGRSQRVVNFLLKLRSKGAWVQRRGVYGLVLGATVLGFYGCAAATWVFGWDERYALLLFSTGFILISAILLFSSMGILRVI